MTTNTPPLVLASPHPPPDATPSNTLVVALPTVHATMASAQDRERAMALSWEHECTMANDLISQMFEAKHLLLGHVIMPSLLPIAPSDSPYI
jgi:hypothetical protein